MNKQIIYFLSLLLLSMNISADQPDWNSYDKLLKHYITQKTVEGIPLNYLNYQGLFQSPLFSEVVNTIESFPVKTLVTKDEKLSFYINAYNIFAIKVVHDHWPLKSIKDAGSWISPVWKKAAGRLDGKAISLDEIEHKILRPMGEPRIHFAIVCASLSCPDLRNEAFNIDHLDAQLNDQVKAFLHNPKKGLNIEGNTAKISKIFDWFEEDFEAQGGIKSFIKKHLPQANFDEVDPDLVYDWSLNGI